MERIGVFCSSRDDLPKNMVEATKALGRWIGEHGKMLVYGGMDEGLMEVLAVAVKRSGGRTMGVIPDDMQNLASDQVDISFPVVDLADRKSTLMREADVFVALPGGVGTLDEFFTVLAAAYIGEHHKPMILFNLDGYWDSLLQLLQEYVKRGFVSQDLVNDIATPTTVEALTKLLE